MHQKVNQSHFDGQSFYIGIDCHSKSWKVTILNEQFELKSMSQDPEPQILANYLRNNYPGGHYHAVYEAGFSGFTACRQMKELGIDCMVIHPADVPTNQKERLQKTDKADSRKLAKCLRSGLFRGIHIPNRLLEADRALVRQRHRLVKDISRIKYRVKSLLYQFGIKVPDRFIPYQSRHWSKVYITWLQDLSLPEERLKLVIENYLRIGIQLRKELFAVNKQIRALAKSQEYKKWYQLMVSIPGIGLIAAMTLLVELGNILRFKRLDELCSYVGLIPSMHSSGERTQTGKITKRGRKLLKIILIEAAWIGIRLDPALTAKFNELTKNMSKNKAIIRIARKILARVRRTLIQQEEYELCVVK